MNSDTDMLLGMYVFGQDNMVADTCIEFHHHANSSETAFKAIPQK